MAINYFNRIEPAQKVQKACQEHGVKAVVIKAVSCVDFGNSVLEQRDPNVCDRI